MNRKYINKQKPCSSISSNNTKAKYRQGIEFTKKNRILKQRLTSVESNNPELVVRFDKKLGHPIVAINEEADEYIVVVITHSKYNGSKQARKNIKLDSNPNPTDTRSAYIENTTKKRSDDDLDPIKKSWTIGQSDYKKIMTILNKKNRLMSIKKVP